MSNFASYYLTLDTRLAKVKAKDIVPIARIR